MFGQGTNIRVFILFSQFSYHIFSPPFFELIVPQEFCALKVFALLYNITNEHCIPFPLRELSYDDFLYCYGDALLQMENWRLEMRMNTTPSVTSTILILNLKVCTANIMIPFRTYLKPTRSIRVVLSIVRLCLIPCLPYLLPIFAPPTVR